ncbi:MAG: C10 family peptidase [Bacteroidales bacterium]|nr:C10 family peptidase [Bacteroidales bacterium]
MKKSISLIIASMLGYAQLYAADITREQALQIARDFANKSVGLKTAVIGEDPTIAYTEKSGKTNKANVYVVNYGNDHGFVVVSGKQGAEADILGYCDHGSFDYDKAPVQMKELLSGYSADIDHISGNKTVVLWSTRQQDLGTVIVEPLLTTQWDQWGPYNQLCPVGCPTGCVPTAVAQVLRYWKWPKQTRGKLHNGDDFSGRSYDWDNMLDKYESNRYNDVQANAVAELMADAGKVFLADYSPEKSPAYLMSQPLVDNFGFSPDIAEKSGESVLDLITYMKQELDERRPVLYRGDPIEGGDGHALVCDGYTSNNYFHFNYGWDGYCDGYYKNAASHYPKSCTIFTGVRPYDAEIEVINDIKYGLLHDGTAEILNYEPESVTDAVLVIPDEVVGSDGNSYKVTRIRKQSFFRKGSFRKVTLGGNVEAIDPFTFIYSTIDTLILSDKLEAVPDQAFQLTGVRTLSIGSSLKRIGKKAFYMCPLTDVTSKSPAFAVDDEAFFQAGPKGEWLDCITSLGYRAFGMCKFTTQPTFKNLEEIGSEAFCTATFEGSTFIIPPKVKRISPDAFYNCGAIFFEDPYDNPYFSAPSIWMITNDNATSLVVAAPTRFPIGDNQMSFPANLTRLEPNSIGSRIYSIKVEGRTYYQGVTLPNTIVEMDGAFGKCETLSTLTCLAVIPPMISDETFNDKIFTNSPDATLVVPEGTVELYRNAPGWRRFPNIEAGAPYVPAPPQAMQYYMVVHGSNDGQTKSNVAVSDITNIRIEESAGRPMFVVSSSGKGDISTDIMAVDSITWTNSFVYGNAEVFDLGADNLKAEAQNCTVELLPTVIDEDVQLCIRYAESVPSIVSGARNGITVDVSLSNGVHELSGTADITIPVDPKSNERVCAAYFNEDTGEWEPVCFVYDENKQEIVITTDHLSVFSAFFIENSKNTARTLLRTAYDAIPHLYDLKEAAKTLYGLATAYDIDEGAVSEWKDNMGFWQSIGLDGGWNYLQAMGFESEALGHAIDAVGYLGTALTIYDVVKADIKGDEVGVASNSLKAILGLSSSVLSSAIGTAIMQASMGTVAFVGVALEKFGTMVQERQVDLYRESYRLYYSKASAAVVSGTSRYGKNWYRTPKDWYEFFLPVFEKETMTEQRLVAYIEAAVREYCDRFWNDTDAQAMCVAETKNQGLSSWFYPSEATRKTISDEFYADLMNGELYSVFFAIKNHLGAKAATRCSKALRDYMSIFNTYMGFRIVDSSWKEGETSKYAGWTIAFSHIPEVASDPQNWKRTITDKGTASLGYFTVWSLIENDAQCKITLFNKRDEAKKDFIFTIPNKTGKVEITLDIDKEGARVEAPELKNLELTYDPAQVPIHYDCYGEYEGEYTTVYSPNWGIMLNNSPLYMNTHMQTELEKYFAKHDFITVDQYGNVTIGDDLTTKLEGKEGKGKFTIETQYQFTEKTLEQFIKYFNDENAELAYRLDNLLNGIIKHKISGDFTVVESDDKKSYTVTYTGEGEYEITAEAVERIDNVNRNEFGDGAEALTGPHKSKVEDITTHTVEQEGTFTLKYETVLEPEVQEVNAE